MENIRQQQINEIARIESLPRPRKWTETKRFLFALRPDLKAVDKGFVEAVKEMREQNDNKFAASTGGNMRNTMKIPQYIYDAILGMDPGLADEWSGKNGEAAKIIGRQLRKAFPEYNVARVY